MENKKVIRDFIYLDIDRLYSLYSQTFEGLAEKIIQSYTDQLTNVSQQSGQFLSGNIAKSEVGEVSSRVENKILHDHMYNKLEKELTHLIYDASNLTLDNYYENLSGKFMIKVSGFSEINDYKRINEFMDKFNDLAEAIAYSISVSGGINEAIENLQNQIKDVKDRNERAKTKLQLDKMKDPKKLAKELGLSQDPKGLKNLILFTEFFYKEGYEIIISPENKSKIVFRGVIDKKLLRKNPEFIRSLYGGEVLSKWTMVGEITYLPSLENNQDVNVDSEEIVKKLDDNNPSMRDPYSNIFKASRTFERMFFESQKRIEVLINPLAIFREEIN